MQQHTIDLLPSELGEDHWRSENHNNGILLRMYGKHQGRVANFFVYYIGMNGVGRRTYNGPLLPGPYAVMQPRATVINSVAVPNATQIIAVEPGDQIVLNGYTFEIQDERLGSDPQLRLVKVPART